MITLSEKTTQRFIDLCVSQSDTYQAFVDEKLFDLEHVNGNMFWAGGAHRLYFDHQKVSDIDLFFRHNLAAKAVEVELEGREYKTIFKCPEGKLTTMAKKGIKVQLITEFFYSSTEELIDSFDITACRYSYDGKRMSLFYSAARDAAHRKIRLNIVTHPSATMKRIAKYVEKGYKLDNQAVDHFIQYIYDSGAEGRPLDRRFYID